MSKLAELLQARKQTDPPANLAIPANPRSPISNFSKGPSSGSAFTPELKRRIEAMAQSWEYSAEELQNVLERARANPSGWWSAVAYHEEREGEFRALSILKACSA